MASFNWIVDNNVTEIKICCTIILEPLPIPFTGGFVNSIDWIRIAYKQDQPLILVP